MRRLNLSHPDEARRIYRRLDELAGSPQPSDAIKMRGFIPELMRVRIGDYRIVYTIDGELLRVVIIGKRNDDDVYKKLKRALLH